MLDWKRMREKQEEINSMKPYITNYAATTLLNIAKEARNIPGKPN
jgi:hypothetical protein